MSLGPRFFKVKLLVIPLTICFFSFGLSALALANEFIVFGPQNFIREIAGPVTVTNNFSVLNPNSKFILRLYNGGLQDTLVELTSSTVIAINGRQVVGPNEFNQKVSFIEVPVILQTNNTIEVEVRGKPNGLITIRIVGIDNAAPNIQIIKPQDGSLTNVNPCEIRFSFNDDVSGIDPNNFKVFINDVDKTNFFFLTATGLSGSASGSLFLAEGTNVIKAGISDFAGNAGSVSWSFIVDTSPPKIAIGGVVDQSLVNQNVTAVITITDAHPDTQTITLNGTPFTSGTTIIADGQYSLQVSATDKAGNVSNAGVSFTIDKTAPVPHVVLSAIPGDTLVNLSWNANTETDLAGYNAYRSTTSGLGYSKLNTSLITATNYQDTGLTNSTHYYYVVTAVDKADNESGYSNESGVVPQSPGLPPPTPTPESGFIHGQVFDAKTSLPLKDVTVTAGGVTGIVLTDTAGKFSFSVPGTGDFGLTFEKDGYVFAQRRADVVSTRHTSVDDVYLTPSDTAVTTITNAGGTHIDSTGRIEVTIPPDSLPQGTGSINVRSTFYDAAKELPMPLPKTSFFTYAFDLKPDGTTFTQPVSGRFANGLGFAPATKIPIGFYNSKTLKWEDTGTMGVVSSDGAWVEFQITHFSSYDCNFPPVPTKGNLPPLPVGNNTLDGDNKSLYCAKDYGNSLVRLKTGELALEHTLPSVKMLDQDYRLTFSYNSLTAHPLRLISIDANNDPVTTNVPAATTVRLTVAGKSTGAVYKGASGKARYSYLYDCTTVLGKALATGSYPYTIEILNDYPSNGPLPAGTYGTADYFGGPATGNTNIPLREPLSLGNTIKGKFVVNNRQNSCFGSGWSLSGLERLYFDPDGTIVLIEGDGSAKTFKKQIKEKPGQNLAVVNYNALYGLNTVSILLSNADGTLKGPVTFPAGQGTAAITAGDFNQDGLTDLATADPSANTVSILLGNGDGTFMPVRAYAVGMPLGSIVSGDLNQDGIPDLAGIDFNGSNVSTLFNNGDGTFGSPANYAVGPMSRSLITGDLNQDGFTDLAVANYQSDKVSILFNNGDGTFTYRDVFDAYGGPYSLAAGNFNQDDFTDLAVAHLHILTNPLLSVLLNNGDGTLQNPVNYNNVANYTLTPGDFNQDGFTDLAGAAFSYPPWLEYAAILLSNGDGTFKGPINYPLGVYSYYVSPVTGDFNRDGLLDLAVAKGSGFPGNESNEVMVLLGNGDGTFKDAISYPAGITPVAAVSFDPKVAYDASYVSSAGDYSVIIQNPDNTYTRLLKDGTKMIFNQQGLHIQTIDKNNNAVAYSYIDANADGAADELGSITLPTGGQYQFHYDSNGKLAGITDPAGRMTQFSIDTSGDLARITNPDNTTESFSYDSKHLIISKTNQKGHTVEYLYDQYGVIKEVRSTERQVTETASDGAVTISRQTEVRIYSPSNTKGLINDIPVGTGIPSNPADVVRPESILETKTDAKGNTWTYKTDKFGGRLQFVDPLGNTTVYERDFNSNLRKLIRPNGSILEMSYDFKGNLLSSKENTNAAIVRLAYERNFNEPVSITDALGNTTKIDYDTSGNPIKITDAQNTTTTLEYNAKGQVTKVTAALGTALNNQTTLAYDPITGNLLTITDPLSHATVFAYDQAGNIVSITDANSKTTRFTYDVMNRLKAVTDADSKVTTYSYDNIGNVISVTDPNNHTTTFAYDEQNQLISSTNPLNEQRLYSYDLNRNLSLIVTPNASQIKLFHNQVNLLEKKFLAEGITTFGYDPSYDLTSVQDPDSSLSFTYDQLSRLTQAKDASGREISYEYDLNSNRTRLIYPDSSYVTYVYDSLNRLNTIKDQADVNIASYGYDALSRRTGLSLANNTQAAYSYDSLNRLLNLVNKTNNVADISSFTYSYDNSGNRLTKTTLSGIASYAYDNIYQLTGITLPDSTTMSFSYDAVGNRASLIEGSQTTAYTANAANRYTQVNATNHTYDPLGNLTSDGSFAYGYDVENRLTSATKVGITASYAYDALGRRIKKDVNNAGTSYLYDKNNIIAEYDSSGNLLRKYVYSDNIDEPITMISGSSSYFYNRDGMGSITEMTDSDGNVVEKYAYDAWGKTVIKKADDNILTKSAIGNRFMFTGREFDSETGLYFYRNRYYSPKMGRFLQEDLIGYYDGMNLYQYVHNNPLNFIDPFGLFNILIGVGGSASAGGGAEGSGGIVISYWKGQFDIGVFGSVGASGGLNVSWDIFGGWFRGGPHDLRGTTANVNITAGEFSGTAFYDPNSGKWLGGTLGGGPGNPPVGGSISISRTGVTTFGDMFEKIFNILLNNKNNRCN